MNSIVTVVVGIAMASLIAASPASAAKCQSSGSAVQAGCIDKGGNPSACGSGFAGCMRTGTYGGMPSGKTWTNVCKK